MRWFKVAAIAVGVVIAFLVVSSVIGFLMEAAIAALVVATVVLAVKAAFYRGKFRGTGVTAKFGGSRYSNPLPHHHGRDVDDELTRLKREKPASRPSPLVASAERDRHECGRRPEPRPAWATYCLVIPPAPRAMNNQRPVRHLAGSPPAEKEGGHG